MNTNDKLGEEFRKVRLKLSLNQKEIAKILNVSHIYISYIEQGKKVPSKDFINRLFSLLDADQRPEDITNLIVTSKTELKNKVSYIKTNSIYLMEEKGNYGYKKLKAHLEKNSDDLHVIYSMLLLLLKDNKKKEAEEHLLNSLMKLTKSEDKKWLQASYHKLEGDYEVAIQLMIRSLEEFEKTDDKINGEFKKKKSLLLFQTACMYFDYAQHLYNDGKNKEAVKNFKIAKTYHQDLRKVYSTPFYQMDYASIFFWLAFLGESTKENWLNYINEAQEALRLNYYEGINNLDLDEWTSVFSKNYIISTISFISRSYGELALIEDSKEKRKEYIEKGEKLFIRSVPLTIDKKDLEYYRFYFNHSCFYSLKAEVAKLLGEEYNFDLDICNKSLNEAIRADSKNNFMLMDSELKSKYGLTFFKKERDKQFSDLLKLVKKKK